MSNEFGSLSPRERISVRSCRTSECKYRLVASPLSVSPCALHGGSPQVGRTDDAHNGIVYTLSLQINERSTDARTLLVTSKQSLGPWLGRYLARVNELRGLRGLAYPLLHSRATPSTSARPLSPLRRAHAPLCPPSAVPAHVVPAIVFKLKSPEPRPHCPARLPHTQQGPQCMGSRGGNGSSRDGKKALMLARGPEDTGEPALGLRGPRWVSRMCHWCVLPRGLDSYSTLTRRIARSLALPAYIFGFQTCRTRRAPALLKNTTNPSTALERPSSAPRVPPRAHAAAQNDTDLRRDAYGVVIAHRASHGRDRGAQSSRTSSPRCARHPDDPVQEGPPRRSPARLLPLSWRSRTRVHTVPEERSSANHKAKQPRRWLAFRRAAVGARRTVCAYAARVKTRARAALRLLAGAAQCRRRAHRPPSSPFAPRESDAVVDMHASSPSAPRETDAFVATAHVEPLNAVVARAAPHPGRSRRPRPTPLWTRCTLTRLTAPSRAPLALIFARRRRARRPSPARFLAGLESPRWRAPRILGDPSSGTLGAAAYGARRTARIRRAGEDAELVLEGLLQQLEAAVAACAFGPSRFWRVCYLAPLQRLRPLARAYAGVALLCAAA
ncbi:hypothetical protein DFH09DRAFT_1320698 [Mycena vulgaris]|nr:hypothetical protein DFH09DRAFT_1320698 [Mycena vulgaris]